MQKIIQHVWIWDTDGLLWFAQDCIFNCHSSHVVMKYLQFGGEGSQLL